MDHDTAPGAVDETTALTVDPVVDQLRRHHPLATQADVGLVHTAFDLAEQGHRDQYRASGDPFLTHPLTVAYDVAALGMDAHVVAAALCHDLPDGTAIATHLGPEVAGLVTGVRNLTALRSALDTSAAADVGLDDLLENAGGDVRVLTLKLADRVHNMATLHALPPEDQERAARETLAVYAPLAARLSLGEVKAFLEDTAFAVTDHFTYVDLKARLEKQVPVAGLRLATIVETAKQALATASIDAYLVGRVKHVYSVHNKLVRRGVGFDDIADLLGIRVVVDQPQDAYQALGVLHAAFAPLAGRVRDYIATPKPGGYRSIHTALADADGVLFEAQVRTWTMHAEAEFGAAAHWRYKAQPVRSSQPGVPAGGYHLAARPILLSGQVIAPEVPWLANLAAHVPLSSNRDAYLPRLLAELRAAAS